MITIDDKRIKTKTKANGWWSLEILNSKPSERSNKKKTSGAKIIKTYWWSVSENEIFVKESNEKVNWESESINKFSENRKNSS